MYKLRLKKLLSEHKMSKNQLARLTKVKPNAVRRYFRKDTDPKLSTLVKWAEAFDCSLDDLVVRRKMSKKAKS
jgi:transcriptional regulator with XRE-family HTH domain